MRARCLRTALRKLDHHADYIAKNDPIAARNAVQRIQAAVDQLAEYLNMGRIGRVPLTRELIVGGTPWIIVYRVRADVVQIIRVLQGGAIMAAAHRAP
jgi:toxin ParE1/3/4